MGQADESNEDGNRVVRYDTKRRVLAVETPVPDSWAAYFGVRDEYLSHCRALFGKVTDEEAWELRGEPEAIADGAEPADAYVDVAFSSMHFLIDEDCEDWWNAYPGWDGVSSLRECAASCGLAGDVTDVLDRIERGIAARDVEHIVDGFVSLACAIEDGAKR